MISVTSLSGWTVEGIYSSEASETFWEIPVVWSGGASWQQGANQDSASNSYFGTERYGQECAWWMVSGETRVSPDPVYEEVGGTSCDEDVPANNIPGCPGVGVAIREPCANDKIGGSIIGHCCNNQNPQPGRPVCKGCGTACGTTSFLNCAIHECNLANSSDNTSPWVCQAYDGGTFLNPSDVYCPRDCGCIPYECKTITDDATVLFDTTSVGGVYSAVLGHPTLRGMAPRGMYASEYGSPSGNVDVRGGTGHFIDTNCGTTTNPYYLDSSMFNKCFLMYPRPAVASVFASGMTLPGNGDYRTTYFDPDYGTYFGRFTTSAFSGGTPINDAEQKSTFFPFWTPPVSKRSHSRRSSDARSTSKSSLLPFIYSHTVR